MGGECIGGLVNYTPVDEFTQPTKDAIAIKCGMKPNVDLSNVALFQGELPNDQVIMAGDFAIKLTEVSGKGAYTGKGYVSVPYLSFVKIGVEFKDISINTDFKLVKGDIKALYDPSWKNIIDVGKIYDQIENVFDYFSPDIEEHQFETNFEIPDLSHISVSSNAIVVTGADGQTQSFDHDPGELVVIRDPKGNVYAIPQEGDKPVALNEGQAAGFIPNAENTQGVSSSGTVTSLAAIAARVTFERAKESKYADDQMPTKAHPAIQKLYKTIPDGATSYNLYHKGIQNDGKGSRSFDYVEAVIEVKGSGIKPEEIQFNIKGSTAKKIGTMVMKNGKAYQTLEVPVYDSSAPVELMALLPCKDGAKNQVLGVAKIIPIKILPEVNLTLIPVNDAVLPTGLQDQLNGIYKDAAVQFKVTVAANYTVAKTEMECGKDALLDKLSEDQATFVETYQKTHPADKNQYYIFVTSGIKPSRPISGFMPRHSQCGFVFGAQKGDDAKAASNITDIIAHELGHGVFELQHPWEEFNTGSKNSNTPWLMDYTSGTKLAYVHWQRISHPKFGVYALDSSEQGELAEGLWFTTNWIAFKGKPDFIPVVEISSDLRPEGTIRKIFVKKENAYYEYDPQKGDYYKEGRPLKIDTSTKLSDSSTNAVYLYKYEGGCGKDKYYKSTYNVVISKKGDVAGLLKNLKPEAVFGCESPSFDNLKETGKEIFAQNKIKVPEKDLQILIEIASIGDKIGKSNYSSYVKKIRNDGNLFWSDVNKTTPYSTENLINTLTSLKKFSEAIQRLKSFNYKTIDELVTDVDTNFKITKGSDNIFVFPSDMKLTQLLTTPFADLDAKRTVFFLDLIKDADFNTTHEVGDPICAEQILGVMLDKFSNEKNIEEKKLIIDHIRSRKYINKFVNINGIYYESFINSMITMVHQVYKAPPFKINPERFLTFSSAYFQLNSESISEQGKVELRVKQWFSDDKYNLIIDPYEYVTVRFVEDVDFGGDFKFKKNQYVQMSAICAYQMFHKDTQNALWKTARIAGEVVLTVIGVGEITAAIRLYRAGQTAYATYIGVKALGDVGFGLVDIYINNSDNSLTDAQKEKWNKFFMIYSIASISTTGLEMLTNKVITKLKKGGNSYNEFEKAVEEANIDIDELYKEHIENSAKIQSTIADQLDLISKRLPINLQEQFNKDFANASEEIVKALQKENSELINGWKKYRTKNPSSILCN
ncbi:hypothetical protein [Flavobacterium davisii]|uniref:Uncharacterized protein n=1 Tax=Flavobacterium columnare TaxID=996 RepID=A0A8G0KSU9_9FLAO|nr:hypothetical protein [Flavobacterium davisii]QYS89498.1 hypothetical protein JJC05_04250 [Flavobacterium davisii]